MTVGRRAPQLTPQSGDRYGTVRRPADAVGFSNSHSPTRCGRIQLVDAHDVHLVPRGERCGQPDPTRCAWRLEEVGVVSCEPRRAAR